MRPRHAASPIASVPSPSALLTSLRLRARAVAAARAGRRATWAKEARKQYARALQEASDAASDRKQYAEAIAKLDALLAPSARASRRRASSRASRRPTRASSTRRSTVFRALIDDYPELPEPYNNLAVLYAQKGEYAQARDDARDRDRDGARLGGRAREPRRHLRASRRRRIREGGQARQAQQDRAGQARAGARTARESTGSTRATPKSVASNGNPNRTRTESHNDASSVSCHRRRGARRRVRAPRSPPIRRSSSTRPPARSSVELYPDAAPKTVANFLEYVKAKHYDGTQFHRVITGFMIQGGGFTPDFKQKPTKPPVAIESEQIEQGAACRTCRARSRWRARAIPTRRPSQFFINVADNKWLELPLGRSRRATATRCSARSSPAWTSSTRSPRRPPAPAVRFPTDVPAEHVVINRRVVVDAAK